MNSGPNGATSWLEVLLAILFVVLVFGSLIFAFAVPILGFFSTHKERWADYSRAKKISVIRTTIVTLAIIGLLIWFSSAPTSNP